MTDTKRDVDLVGRLTEAVRDAISLLEPLRAAMKEQDAQGPSTGTTHNAPESRPPWNSAAANAYFDIINGAESLARTMAYDIGVRRGARFREDPLRRVLDLAPAAGEWILREAIHRVENWVDRGKQVPAIDESEPWVALPAAPGFTPPCCPFCGTFALRMLRRAAQVRCFLPGCHDGDQRPTRARMEPGRMTGEARLVFGDGTMMHWQETE